jgi:hypothetical protein
MQNDSASSCDPILDHLMSSSAFKCVVWFFFAALMAVGLIVVVLNMRNSSMYIYRDRRVDTLLYIGMPTILGVVPVTTMIALPISRRLK